jgi:hypothetical protein
MTLASDPQDLQPLESIHPANGLSQGPGWVAPQLPYLHELPWTSFLAGFPE